METFSFKTIEFKQVDFLGEWKLDWSSHGQPRYKPRTSASLKISTHDGNIIDVLPAKDQPVTITENIIHIPVDLM
jgi:hypothetical protein